jgi:hypothetical protein
LQKKLKKYSIDSHSYYKTAALWATLPIILKVQKNGCAEEARVPPLFSAGFATKYHSAVATCRWGKLGLWSPDPKVSTPKFNSDLFRTSIKATVNTSQWTQVRQNMFSIPTQGFKGNQWQLRSTLRQPMGGGACCTWGCSIKHKSSVYYRCVYHLYFGNF